MISTYNTIWTRTNWFTNAMMSTSNTKDDFYHNLFQRHFIFFLNLTERKILFSLHQRTSEHPWTNQLWMQWCRHTLQRINNHSVPMACQLTIKLVNQPEFVVKLNRSSSFSFSMCFHSMELDWKWDLELKQISEDFCCWPNSKLKPTFSPYNAHSKSFVKTINGSLIRLTKYLTKGKLRHYSPGSRLR